MILKFFHGCVKVFDKKYMRKEIVDSNIFFNYAVKVLIQDCILPELNQIVIGKIKEKYIEDLIQD